MATVKKVKQGLVIILVNPYNKNYPKIRLPPLEFEICHIDYRYGIKKFVLTTDPASCPDNYIVVVSYSTYGKLAIFRADQHSWTYHKRRRVPPFEIFSDAIVYKGSVFIAGIWNDIVFFEIGGRESEWPPIIKVAARKTLSLNCHQTYLVETSRGELFVGDSYSTAIPASKIYGCLESNSIYFTDQEGHVDGHHDIGVFHLEDRSFGTHYKFNFESEKLLPPAILTFPPC